MSYRQQATTDFSAWCDARHIQCNAPIIELEIEVENPQPESPRWMQTEYDRLIEKSKRVGISDAEQDMVDYFARELAYEAGYMGREYQ